MENEGRGVGNIEETATGEPEELLCPKCRQGGFATLREAVEHCYPTTEKAEEEENKEDAETEGSTDTKQETMKT